MGIKADAQIRKDITWLDPRLLSIIPGFNVVREEDTEIFKHAQTDLEAQIDAQGVLVPLVLKKNRGNEKGYFVVDGYRRLACVMSLITKGKDIKAVPTRFEADGTNDVDRALNMINLNGGLPVTPYGKAKAIKMAHGLGASYAEIAEKTGITMQYIESNLIPLLESPQQIINEVKAGNLSASLAVQVQKDNPTDAAQVLQKAGEIAKAHGKTKTTPKHVRAAQAAMEPAPSDADKVSWEKVGPKLLKHLVAVCEGDDPKKAVKAAKAYLATLSNHE